jgi:hypothetical protein
MMYEFLRDSSTDGARAKMATEARKYTVNGTKDGPCYLKALLIKFHVETNATNYHLRQQLQRLTTTIAELKYDIASFNDRVTKLVEDLAAGGETSSGLMVHVFEAYLSVQDKTFHNYIERKKEAYDEGTEDINVETIMD